ncbi:hypothetical protein Bca101_070989 [Brassica carinata]
MKQPKWHLESMDVIVISSRKVEYCSTCILFIDFIMISKLKCHHGSSAKKSLAKFDVKLQAVSGFHQNWKRNLKRQRQKYSELKVELSRIERHILNDGQKAWNLDNDRDCDCKNMDEEFTRYAATRIKEYMKDNRSKDEIVRILQQQHAIPVYLTMKAWDQIEIESPGFFEEYFVQTLLNPDAETTDQGPTQLASTSMGTAGRDTGASSSSLHVPPPTGDALIPVQQALSSGTAQNVPIVTRAQVPPLTGDSLSPVQLPLLDNLASSSSSQVPPETANTPVQQPLSPKTEILMKILATLVEMKSKQDQMLHLMSDGHDHVHKQLWLLGRFFSTGSSAKKSLAKFDVKIVAASCVWLASKLEENPKRQDGSSLCSTFISNYLATLETPPELRQEAWNLANDSLLTTLCVRCRSEVVACGVVYAADCCPQVSILALLYSLPKAQYISVCKDGKPFTFSTRSGNTQAQSSTKDVLPAVHPVDTKCVQLITSLRME